MNINDITIYWNFFFIVWFYNLTENLNILILYLISTTICTCKWQCENNLFLGVVWGRVITIYFMGNWTGITMTITMLIRKLHLLTLILGFYCIIICCLESRSLYAIIFESPKWFLVGLPSKYCMIMKKKAIRNILIPMRHNSDNLRNQVRVYHKIMISFWIALVLNFPARHELNNDYEH